MCPRLQVQMLSARARLALDINPVAQIEEARKQTDNIMDVLMEDKEFRELLMKKLREQGISG